MKFLIKLTFLPFSLIAGFLVSIFLISSLTQAQDDLLINGAGATFPYILYSKWFSEYSKTNPVARINYRSIGSSGGIQQLIRGTVDFGASDIPVQSQEQAQMQVPIIHIPTTLSAVILTYNLPLLKDVNLKMTGPLISKIFRGVIKKWNHPEIVKLNPKLAKVDQNIITIYRADGSGTTAILTEYLGKVDPKWLHEIGKGKSIRWPVGVGSKGNEGVLGLVQKLEGSLAYVGMSYALNRKLPMVHVQNQSGKFIKPSIASIQSAAQNSVSQKKSYTESIVNSKGVRDYPISSFTYLLVYQEMPQQVGQVMSDFLKWSLDKGQDYSLNLHYIPLPSNIVKQARLEVKKIKFKK